MSAPISRAERLGLLDALRGFALFGVLAVNLGIYSGWWGMPRAQALALPSAHVDSVAREVTRGLLYGKAITLFSFLFGVGFAVYLQRNDVRRWGRRVGILFLLALAHALIWPGDILLAYALMGLVLIAWRRGGDRLLVALAFALCTAVALGPVLRMLFPSFPRVPRAIWNATQAPTWADAFVANWRVWRAYWLTPSLITFLPGVLGRMLLGYVVGRRRLLHDAPAHLTFFRKLFVVSIVIALPTLAITHAAFLLFSGSIRTPTMRVLFTVLDELGTIALAATYLAGFTLLYQRPRFRSWVAPLEAVGRMALTNYVAQSVMCTLLFYQWALGLSGGVHATASLVLAVLLFALQVVASRAWLARFRFGPLEWLWRSLTYGKAQPFRVSSPSTLT